MKKALEWILAAVAVLSMSTVAWAVSNPTTVSASRCGSGSVNLVARGAAGGAVYRWFAQPTGGNAVQVSADSVYATPVLYQTTTYYVAIDSLGEVSARVPVVATINKLPRQLANKETPMPATYMLNLPFDGSIADASTPTNPTRAAGVPITYVADRNGVANGAAYFAGNANSGINTLGRFTAPQAFTISVWVLVPRGSGTRSIIGASNSILGPNPSQADRELTVNNSGFINFYTFNSNPDNVTVPRNIADSTWHHIILSTTSNGRNLIYLDGEKVLDRATSGSYQAYGAYWRVGFNYRFGGTGGPFLGAMDDLKVYNYALNPDQIEQLLTPGTSLTTSATQFCGLPEARVQLKLTNATNGFKYSVLKSGMVVDSAFAAGDSVVLHTDTVRSTTAYQISVLDTLTGCGLLLDTTVNVAVGTLPDTLPAQRIANCGTGRILVPYSLGAGETIKWYLQPMGGLPAFVGDTLLSAVIQQNDSVVYYAARVGSTGCESARTPVTVVALSSPGGAAQLATAPHTWFSFDNGSRGNLGTSTNRATVPAGVRDTTDRFGNRRSALAFDGNSRVQSSTSIANPQVFTLSIWAKLEDTLLSSTNQTLIAFNNSQNGDGSQHDRVVSITNVGTIEYFTFGTGSGTLTGGVSVADGNWHHILVRQSAAGSEIFVDGNLAARNGSMTGAQAYSGFWRLGQRQSSLSFRGLLDDFVFINSAVSDAEIRELYTSRLVLPAAPQSACAPGINYNLTINFPEAGVNYQLVDASTQSPLGAAVSGGADSLVLSAGLVSSSTSVQVLATNTTTGCSRIVSAPVQLTVFPLPAVARVRDTVACNAVATVLTARGATGTDAYRWYDSETSTTPLQSGNPARPIATATLNLTSRQPGDSVVRYVSIINANGCESARQRIVARWFTNPSGVVIAPAGTASYCTGDSVLLTAPAGFARYVWNNGATTPSIYAKTPGTVNVRVFTAQGCNALSANVTVSAIATPGTPTVTLNNRTLSATFSGGTTNVIYRWFLNGVLTNRSTATLNLVAPADTGTWTLVVVRQNCASDTSNGVYFQVTNLQTNVALAPVKLYPNPATHLVRISGVEVGTLKQISVLDMAGRVVLSTTLPELDITALDAGMYQVLIETELGTAMRRLVKQ